MIAYMQSYVQPGAIRLASAVLLAALAMKGDAERLLAEGFDGYLEKPIRYKAFLGEVERLFGAGPRR